MSNTTIGNSISHNNINSSNTNTRAKETIIDETYNKIISQPLECDLLVSLLNSAALSSRRHNVCEPFPSLFKSGHLKEFDRLTNAFDSIPSISKLKESKERLNELPMESLTLLDYIVNGITSFKVKQIQFKEFESRTKYLSGVLDHLKTAQLPSHIFEFVYDEKIKRNSEFQTQQLQYGSMLGYHGSANDCWNSILRGVGFQDRFISDQCIFGPGFYFSTDSAVSQSFVKMGKWWKDSVMGNKVGCLSACEILDTEESLRGTSVPSNRELTDEDKALPDHYILCKLGSHIRMKYLLVFKESSFNNQNNNNSVQINNQNNSINQLQSSSSSSSSSSTSQSISSSKIFSNDSNNSNNSTPSVYSPNIFKVGLAIVFVICLVYIIVLKSTASGKHSKSSKPTYFHSRIDL